MKRAVLLALILLGWDATAWAQSVSGVRAFGGGVGPLFGLVGPGNLYLDNQGTQGYMYTFNNFESYSFRNPTTGQAWSGAVMTLGPQLSIGVIQGVNQVGSPVVLVPPPQQPPSVLISPFSLGRVNFITPPSGGLPTPGGVPSILLVQPSRQAPAPVDIESSLLDIP